MKPIAIIPARGGSKRLPRKNILSFLGVPLISWPIQTALRSGLFSHVFVSTEDEEIAQIAQSFGAQVINRPVELAQDRSTVVQVCIDALHQLQLNGIEAIDLCCIYATAALLTIEDLNKSYEQLSPHTSYDSIMGVARYDLSPLQALEEKEGLWKLRWPEFHRVQSQFYPELLCSCGMMYWIKSESLIKQETFYTEHLGIYEIPRERLSDINTAEDFKILEWRARHLGITPFIE